MIKANTMVEFTIDEAYKLLTRNLTNANSNILSFVINFLK